tara:strand:- start:2052 stop:2858 length:807 start_codon:yes stop_codon:yes gene_type:complete
MKQLKYLIVVLFISCGFSSVQIEIQRGEKAEESQDYKVAAKHFSRAMKREPGTTEAYYAAKKLANIALIHLDDIEIANRALNYIILNTTNIEDKKSALERKAKIQYEKIRNYEQAIIEFQRFLQLEKRIEKRIEIQYLIAHSYFYMNRLFQAEQELEEIFKVEKNKKTREYIFRARMMQANIYHAQKKYEEAASAYRNIIDTFPKLSLNQKVWMNLSVCLEDMKKFKDAIALLESVDLEKNEKVFVKQRISRLKDRLEKEPGAKGLRR